MKKKNLYFLLNISVVILITFFIIIANKNLDSYVIRILNLCAIYIILGVSLNLINGFTGQFSLGHAGFMAIGAYVSALLYMSPELKEANYFITPLIWPLSVIQIPFVFSLIIAGLISAGVGFLVGVPCLRLKGDYLAIVTFGFSEIIRVTFNNLQNVTNGPIGLKGLPIYTNLWWSFGIAILTVVVVKNLINSSYGRALKSIRENETAAEAMGVSLFFHKSLAFAIGAFFAGLGGALLGSFIMTIDPNTFSFLLTFQLIVIVIVGGLGSITGTIISAIIITVLMELLRSVEAPMNIFGLHLPGVPGMRMLVFAILLMTVVLFFKKGLMGKKEWSWDGLFKKIFPMQREIEKGN
ncbi:MAG TPA: branched-chain amino acid ABC transporter permease [Candidatus Atribacteria bacterium]|nr:branched-chain amino acid ABC transporter permease [Candidatus Atribacteria bacterium]